MSCFQNFRTDISGFDLPTKFTYPFYYSPHPLALIAAQELQSYLLNQQDFVHDFGLTVGNHDSGLGKMFGVLVVQKQDGQIGYLTAFSGKLEDESLPDKFVPPIYNVHEENAFFKLGEVELVKLTEKIQALENDPIYIDLLKKLEIKSNHYQQEIKRLKTSLKESKTDRQKRRTQAKESMDPQAFESFNQGLSKESIDGQLIVKKQTIELKDELSNIKTELDQYTQKITELKILRKTKSRELQKKVFDQYQFLDINHSLKSLTDIFPNFEKQKPPGGTGECSAPKLLQYAFQKNLKPIALAEFWWGISPKKEVRKHKQFYPACRGRCKPILAHMLHGMEIDDNPMKNNPIPKDLTILFEDSDILVINKPADYLTVPGKMQIPSVYTKLKEMYPNIEEPVIVHRLDMSTSGVLVLAKTKHAHKALQSQFLNRTVKKRYVAVLDGTITENEGMIELPLRVDLDDRPRQLVCYEYGKFAKTKWKVIESKYGQTRVHLYPITGRTHQLRVHMAHSKGLNTAIIGDDLYGSKAERLYLHAEYLQFIHPTTKRKMKFKVEADF